MTSQRLIFLPAVWLVMTAVLTIIGDAAPIASLAYENGNFKNIPRFFFTRAKGKTAKTLEFPPEELPAEQEDTSSTNRILLLSVIGDRLQLADMQEGEPMTDYGELLRLGDPEKNEVSIRIMYKEHDFETSVESKGYVNLRAKNRYANDFRLYTTPTNFDLTSLDYQKGVFVGKILYSFKATSALDIMDVPEKVEGVEYAPNILQLKTYGDQSIFVERLKVGEMPPKHKDLFHFRLAKGTVELLKPKGYQPFNKIIYNASVVAARHPIFNKSHKPHVNLKLKGKDKHGGGFRLYTKRDVSISYDTGVLTGQLTRQRRFVIGYPIKGYHPTLAVSLWVSGHYIPVLEMRKLSAVPIDFCLAPLQTENYPPVRGLSNSKPCAADELDVYLDDKLGKRVKYLPQGIKFELGRPLSSTVGLVAADLWVFYDTNTHNDA